MATSLLPDPRLNGAVSTYDREATIAALTEYYKALGKLPYVNEVDIIYPPPSGWPNITKENFAALEKNDEVIELLQRLPYLNNPNDWGKGYAVSFATFVIDYSSEPFGPQIDVKKAEYYSPDFAFPDEKVKPWVIPLTWSEDNVVGAYLLLDTTDGTVTEWGHQGWEQATAEYPPEDPRSWRNTCGETWKLSDLLTDWRTHFETLNWVAFWEKGGRAHVWNDDEPKDEDTKETNEMQAIIRAHGWPDNFKRDECKKALAEWVENRPDPQF